MVETNEAMRRHQPYIVWLKTHGQVFLVCDTRTILVTPSHLAIAMELLINTHFAFHIKFAAKACVAINFLARYGFKVTEGSATSKARKLWAEFEQLANF